MRSSFINLKEEKLKRNFALYCLCVYPLPLIKGGRVVRLSLSEVFLLSFLLRVGYTVAQ